MKILSQAQNSWRLPKKKKKEKASSWYSSERRAMKNMFRQLSEAKEEKNVDRIGS